MKTILIGNFPTCISVYKYLIDNNLLVGVCFDAPKQNEGNLDFWKNSIEKEDIATFEITKDNFNNDFIDWLKIKDADLIIVCGFSLKFTNTHLKTTKHSFLNIHFGKLPENRGANPLFWSIKKGESKTAITVHKVNEEWDSGKIIIEKEVAIIPGETLGMVNSKMSFLLSEVIPKALELIVNEDAIILESNDRINIYNNKPTKSDSTINWEVHTAEEIENLVNACNPTLGGATTYFQGGLIKIIEVSPVDEQVPLLGQISGEIVHAHPQEGLYVRCRYGKLLKLNIISSDAGVLTGNKYVFLGIQTGQRFNTYITKNKY